MVGESARAKVSIINVASNFRKPPFQQWRGGSSLGEIMTTIAYKDGFLEADKRVTAGWGHIVSDEHEKIRTLEKGSIAVITGCANLESEFISFAEGKGSRPSIKSEDSDATLIEAFKKNGDVFIVTHHESGPMSLKNPEFCAFGSGREVAMGAMHAGKTAAEAVRIASMVDAYTGPNVSIREVPVLREEKEKRGWLWKKKR